MSVLRLTGVTVDLTRRSALRRGVPVALTPMEVRLLAFLREEGGVVDRARLLEQVWGYRPGLSSRTVDTTMRRLREKVELDPNAPRHLLTVHGQGYRWMGAPALPDLGPLVGRRRELAAVLDAVGRARVVTIYGLEGQGRATLARHAASRWGPSAELPRAREANTLDAALAKALGLRGADTRALKRLDRVGEHLLLLRADTTAERLLLQSWMPGRIQGGLRAIVVSDAALGLDDEIALPLGGLDEADAMALLRERVGPAPTDAALRQLANAWDGWPLALLHEAHRLSTGATTGHADHRLDAVLARSWASTPPDVRLDLARLAVGATAQVSRDEALPWLARVAGRPAPPPAVSCWIAAQPEGQRALDERAEALAALVKADPEGLWDDEVAAVACSAAAPDRRAGLALALAERALNLGAEADATGWLDLARSLGAPAGPISLLESRLHRLRGDLAGGTQRLRSLVGDASAPPELVADARTELALHLLLQGDREGAEALLEAPGPTSRHQLLRAHVRAVIAQTVAAPDAVAQWRRVIAEAERLGRRRLVARWSTNLGIMLRVANREAEAEGVLQRSLALLAEVGDVPGEVYARICLAQARFDRGDLPATRAQLDVAEALMMHRDQPRDRLYLLGLRAAIALEEGDPVAARSLCEDALNAYTPGFPPAAVYGLLGSAHWLVGDLAQAERALAVAADTLDASPAPDRVRQATRARLLAVRSERGDCAPPEAWPPVGSADVVAAAVDVERLHLVYTTQGLEVTRAGWRALRPPRSGADRVSRVLFLARLRRDGLDPDEVL